MQPMKTIIFCLFAFALAHASIINVPADQATIQEGINAAADGDTVLVAEGTYYENINYHGKAITVASHFAVDGDTTHIANTIIDGSQATNADRASVVYFESGEDTTSVLMGLTITGGKGTKTGGTVFGKIIKGGGIFCKNSGPRISHNHIIANAIDTKKEGGGAAIYAVNNTANPTIIIENNVVSDNSVKTNDIGYGGAIMIEQMRGRLLKNVIMRNSLETRSTCWGGAVFVGNLYAEVGNLDFTIESNTISNNSMASTGNENAIANVYIRVERAIVKENTVSENRGTGRWLFGIGLYISQAGDGTLVEGNVISNNTSESPASGGGLYINEALAVIVRNNEIVDNECKNTDNGAGGGVFITKSENVLVDSNTISGNHAYVCGGVYYHISSGTVSNNVVTGNTARIAVGIAGLDAKILVLNNRVMDNISTRYGGGISLMNDCQAIVKNNLILGNKAGAGGGVGVWTFSNALMMHGMPAVDGEMSGSATAALSLQKTMADSFPAPKTLLLVNNTICNNKADQVNGYGGGLFAMNWKVRGINNIIWGNQAPTFPNIKIMNASVQLHYCSIEGGFAGQHNLEEHPQFADDDRRLADASPCIGAGIAEFDFNGVLVTAPATDFNGDLRPQPEGSNPDVGAFECAQQFPTNILSQIKAPNKYDLQQNYPNPFNPTTTIEYSLPQPAQVSLAVYNLRGQMVRSLVDEEQIAGMHTILWRGEDGAGAQVGSGLYLYRLRATDAATGEMLFSEDRKMALMR